MINRLLPVLLFVIAVGIIVGYVRPTYADSVSELQARINSYNTALEAAARYDARQAELTRQRNDLPQDALSRLDAFLPDGVDQVRAIMDLSALANRTGVVISGFSFQGGSTGNTSESSGSNGLPLDSLDIAVTVTASYDAFRTFLTSLETSLHPMDVIALGLKPSDTGVYTYTLTVRTYWLR